MKYLLLLGVCALFACGATGDDDDMPTADAAVDDASPWDATANTSGSAAPGVAGSVSTKAGTGGAPLGGSGGSSGSPVGGAAGTQPVTAPRAGTSAGTAGTGTGGAAGAAGAAGTTAGTGTASSMAVAGSGGQGGAGAGAPAPLYDCPTGTADADANGYPDACETLLWRSGPANESWPHPVVRGPRYNWEPSKLEMTLSCASRCDYGVIGSDDDIDPGVFVRGEPPTTPARIMFSGVNDVRIYSVGSDWGAPLIAAYLLTAPVDATVFVDDSVSGSIETAPGLRGKHIVYFKRTITGYGYDTDSYFVAVRGGWEAYGY